MTMSVEWHINFRNKQWVKKLNNESKIYVKNCENLWKKKIGCKRKEMVKNYTAKKLVVTWELYFHLIWNIAVREHNIWLFLSIYERVMSNYFQQSTSDIWKNTAENRLNIIKSFLGKKIFEVFFYQQALWYDYNNFFPTEICKCITKVPWKIFFIILIPCCLWMSGQANLSTVPVFNNEDSLW